MLISLPLCFLGSGIDCFRTTEAILMGAIPIVQNSSGMWPLYRNGPFLVLNSLSDVNITREFLLDYEPPTKSKAIAFAPYWMEKINNLRKNSPLLPPRQNIISN